MTVDCPSCGDPMPAARLTIEIANGVCGICNQYRPARVYVEGASGFKNNGACITTVDIARANKIANPVRG